MSAEDKARWEARYADGAYAERRHPSALLERWLPQVPRGRALDVACGSGRNALWLAAHGYEVVAIDVAENALQALSERAQAERHHVRTIAWDLDNGLPPELGRFQLVVKLRFLALDLIPALIERLAPGGVLVAEVLLGSPSAAGTVGPQSARFRAAPGALVDACAPLDVWHTFEGALTDPDGRGALVAQLVGRRRPEADTGAASAS